MSPRDIMPVAKYVAHTLAASEVEVCQCIIAEVAGRVNLTQPDGVVRANFPLFAGYNPVKAKVVNDPTSGTAATGVWLGYAGR